MKSHIRIAAYILGFALVLSAVEFLGVRAAADSNTVRITRLTEIFSLTATAFFYLGAILPPLTHLVPELSKDPRWSALRKSSIIAAVYFTVWHVILAFFTQLGGFNGLPFLNDRYLLAVIIGFAGLVVMTIISIANYLKLHTRILNLKAIAIVEYVLLLSITLHALMLGNHFADLLNIIPDLFIIAVAVLFVLNGIWFDSWLKSRFKLQANLGLSAITALVLSTAIIVVLFFSPSNVSLNVHNDHGLSSDGTGLSVPMPPAPSVDLASKVVKDYNVSLRQPTGKDYVVVQLVRLNAPQPESVGQASALFVNEEELTSFKVDGSITNADPGVMNFTFPLNSADYTPGIHDIFLKFYLPTGGLQTDFTVNLR